MPSTGSETTTKAGELRALPVAQFGWQVFTARVPLPDPVLVSHDDHVTVDRDMRPSQPMSILVGRSCDFAPGSHDATVGRREAAVAEDEAFVVADGDDAGVVAASVTTLVADVG